MEIPPADLFSPTSYWGSFGKPQEFNEDALKPDNESAKDTDEKLSTPQKSHGSTANTTNISISENVDGQKSEVLFFLCVPGAVDATYDVSCLVGSGWQEIAKSEDGHPDTSQTPDQNSHEQAMNGSDELPPLRSIEKIRTDLKESKGAAPTSLKSARNALLFVSHIASSAPASRPFF
jgi:hypothetical protein